MHYNGSYLIQLHLRPDNTLARSGLNLEIRTLIASFRLIEAKIDCSWLQRLYRYQAGCPRDGYQRALETSPPRTPDDRLSSGLDIFAELEGKRVSYASKLLKLVDTYGKWPMTLPAGKYSQTWYCAFCKDELYLSNRHGKGVRWVSLPHTWGRRCRCS